MLPRTLTIGIPTYNRANTLQCLLDSICAQIPDALRSRLDIFVSDNASSDTTRDIIQNYESKFPGLINYHRNQTNIGFSQNVDNAVRSAKGDYVLIMSDDDVLEPTAIADIFSVLDSNENIGIISLSHQVWAKDLSRPVAAFHARPNKLYPTGSEFIKESRSFTSALISGYVFNRKRWIESRPERFFDINSIHLIISLVILASSAFYTLNDKPYVRYRTDMGHWSIDNDPTYPFPLFASYLKGCKAIVGLYPDNIQASLYCSTIRTAIGHVIRNKVLGFPFPKHDIFEILSPYFDRRGLKRRLFTCMFVIASTCQEPAFTYPSAGLSLRNSDFHRFPHHQHFRTSQFLMREAYSNGKLQAEKKANRLNCG